MIVKITLTTAQVNATLFDLYSDVDGYVTPFETSIDVATLQTGYTSVIVPEGTTIIRVQNIGGTCVSYVDLLLTTTTTTSSSTTSTTTTIATVECNATANSGGVGVTEYVIPLSVSGGSIIMDFNAYGVPDKLEIVHNSVKKATSGMIAANAGPFDNLYGDPTVPTSSEASLTDQFIGTSKGTVPNRAAEFLADTGITTVTPTKQQLVWWVYDNTDFTADQYVTIRITGPTGTAWEVDRLCEIEPTTTTTTTSSSTTTTTTTVAPTTTTTTTTSAGETGLVDGSYSTTTSASPNCGEVQDGICSVNITVPDTLSVGDQVYSDLGGTTAFVGNGDYYNIVVNFIVGSANYSGQIDASGIIIGTLNLCP